MSRDTPILPVSDTQLSGWSARVLSRMSPWGDTLYAQGYATPFG